MNPLQSALIEKAGYDNGFENTLRADDSSIELSSARHAALLRVRESVGGYLISLEQGADSLAHALQREFASAEPGIFHCNNETALHQFLRRAAALSRSLPNQAVNDYLSDVADELARLPSELQNTEVARMVRQRLGQDRFRSAMLDYWGSACAVTGIRLPELLRASHALPWAECQSDVQRLDVFNGFLLCAHLDALFDRFLISFDAEGRILFSPGLDRGQLAAIGVTDSLKLRWLDERHHFYLDLHRKRLSSQLTVS